MGSNNFNSTRFYGDSNIRIVNMNNEVLLSPCTYRNDFESMKIDFINMIKAVDGGALATIETEKMEHGYICCSTNIDQGSSGYGYCYFDVKFVNPESIINVIRHCCGEAKVKSIGISVEDIDNETVELTLVSGKHAKRSNINH